ncbi:class B sortase [uncultured Clostridium sp.]|jgi:putative sortase B|uniref:class B sortase n=1 Tax=uncultured Clostridium sp. TaxID=59620 RepID=UPI00280BE408|nr:class B sortase [uncultured Clostridium sp.]
MKKSIIFKNIIVLVSLVLGILFLYLGFKEYQYTLKSKYKNETIREMVVEDSNDPLNRRIDFKKLKSENEDIVAWIYIPKTSIDYPIVIGDTDEEYLYKDIEGNYSPLGAIFTYANTKKDFSDSHIKVFGHNMKEFQMFGELRKFLNVDYMKEHKKFYIYTDRKTIECGIVSIFITNENDSIFGNTSSGIDFLTTLSERNVNSNYDLLNNMEKLSDSQIFSLVTCNGVEGTTERFLVNGVAVKEKILFN